MVTVLRLLVSFYIVFTYPLQCYPSRNSAVTLIRHLFNHGRMFDPAAEQRLSNAITVGFLLGTMGVAASTSNLGIVFELIGATGCTAVTYILPAYFFYRLSDPAEATGVKLEQPSWKRRLSLAQLCLGIAIVPLCVACILAKYIGL